MTINGIAHVQIAIREGGEADARAFYGELLGLPEIPKPDSLRDRGGCWFAASPPPLPHPARIRAPMAPAANRTRTAKRMARSPVENATEHKRAAPRTVDAGGKGKPLSATGD